jgi:hypothetical protein
MCILLVDEEYYTVRSYLIISQTNFQHCKNCTTVRTLCICYRSMNKMINSNYQATPYCSPNQNISGHLRVDHDCAPFWKAINITLSPFPLPQTSCKQSLRCDSSVSTCNRQIGSTIVFLVLVLNIGLESRVLHAASPG